MFPRAIITASRLATRRVPAVQASRQVHKGIEGTPPMRWMSIPEKMGLYFIIAFSFLSYPTYLMGNLDNLRPKGENELGESALAEAERRRAARN